VAPIIRSSGLTGTDFTVIAAIASIAVFVAVLTGCFGLDDIILPKDFTRVRLIYAVVFFGACMAAFVAFACIDPTSPAAAALVAFAGFAAAGVAAAIRKLRLIKAPTSTRNQS
jgi:hypothetical protein